MTEAWTIPLDGTIAVTRDLVGGKALSIAEMLELGLPVPPAFVITTRACLDYLATGQLPAGLETEIADQLAKLESAIGRRFGNGQKRLLLSVRSGAAISMPGMMDTVLNLGIDDEGEQALANETGMADFARDTHRRFVELFAAIVLKQPVELDPDAPPEDWRAQLAGLGAPLPQTAQEQLLAAIRAVFDSWNTRRAKRYRKHNSIDDNLGTAVTVQAMVFGNLDERSGTGVLFSRNPLTGEKRPYGEYLPRAQGEDVVSGKFTPLPLSAMEEREADAHTDLLKASEQLEQHHGDVQDIEFTVQSGKLYLLQSRSAKRAPQAALRFAVDMVAERMITPDTALSRISAEQVAAVLLPRLSASVEKLEPIASGEGACPGAACGILVADADEAERRSAAGENIILVRKNTSPDDVHGMIAARGVVTEQGGTTSHAAVVSRALGRPCVVGTGEGIVARAGEMVTIDGAKGLVFAGSLPTEIPSETDDPSLSAILGWIPEAARARVASPETADIETFNIDPLLADGTMDGFEASVANKPAISGEGLKNPDVIRAADSAGVRIFHVAPALPALLALYHGGNS